MWVSAMNKMSIKLFVQLQQFIVLRSLLTILKRKNGVICVVFMRCFVGQLRFVFYCCTHAIWNSFAVISLSLSFSIAQHHNRIKPNENVTDVSCSLYKWPKTHWIHPISYFTWTSEVLWAHNSHVTLKLTKFYESFFLINGNFFGRFTSQKTTPKQWNI